MGNRKHREVVEVEKFTTGFIKNLFKDGRFGSVNFTKKKDGSNRTLNGKNFVNEILVGGEAPYDAESYGQVRVVDVNVRKDRKGNPVPRHSEFRAVTAENVHWITANGKKYVRSVAVEPKLNFVQSITHNYTTQVLRVVLSGVVYAYFNVPRKVYVDFIDAENKGQYLNDYIKGVYEFKRIS